MKLAVGDIIEVQGWVMMKGLDDGGKYRVNRIGQCVGHDVYWFTKPKGRKEVVGHYVNDVDLWVGTENLNRIVVIGKK